MPSPLKSLILTISGTIFVGLVLLSALNAKHDYDSAIAAAHDTTRHQAQTLSEHAARSFEAVDLVLQHMVDQLQRDMIDIPRNPQQVQDALQAHVDLTPQIRALVVVNAKGLESASNTGRGIGLDLSDRDYFKAHRDDPAIGLRIGKPLVGRVTGNWFLSVTRPISKPDGTFGGVVVAIVSQEYFRDFYQVQEDVNATASALTTVQGDVFASSAGFPPEGIDLTGESLSQTPLFRDHVGDVFQGTFEMALFDEETSLIISYGRVEDLPLMIVTHVEKNAILLQMFDHMKAVVVVIVVTAVILTFLLMTTADQIRQREEVERQLRHMANHDLLTNLPNRRQGIEYLERAIADARRRNSEAAVLFVDLDGFKAVNDDFGHDAGDTVLVTIAQRLLEAVRTTDAVARLGGDEFLVILSDLKDETVLPRISEKLLKAANSPIDIDGVPVTLSASVGIALYPKNGDLADVLISQADEAMYSAKQNGKDTFHFAPTDT